MSNEIRKDEEDPFVEASQAVDALYNIRDTYFPANPDDKTSKLVTQSNLALQVLGNIPQEKRDMPGQRATYEYLRGKLLDVFPEYKKEAEYHLSKALKLNPSLTEQKETLEIDADSEDEDFIYDEDSADDLLDDIIFEENIDMDVEWVGTRDKENKVESSDSSENSENYGDNSDFESLCSKDDDGEQIVQRAGPSRPCNVFMLGQLFSTKHVFKDAVNTYAVKIGRPTQFVKNDARRIYARCKKQDEGCAWHINALKVKDEASFQIRELDLTHSCTRQYHVSNAKSGWLAQKFERSFRCDPKKSIKGFRNTVIFELGIYISPHQAFRAKQKALKLIEGDSTEQYSKLWDYAETLKEKNPGSTVILQLENTPTGKSFKRFYVCLQAMKKGFMSGCRPWIGVDGCHLKGLASGVLLTAVGMDPNNDPYPLAYAMVGVENRDSWEWFLQLLKNDLLIERENVYTFMSDKQNGLIGAFEKILQSVENRFCVRHLHGNMKRAGFKGHNFKKLLWRAANATTVAAFNIVMLEIQQLDMKCLEWLQRDKSATEWSKSHFSTFGKCDTLVNNMCEQFNSCILDAREKPVLTMLEWIREYMMTRLQKNRDRAERKWEGRHICGRIRVIVGKNQEAAADCIPIKSTDKLYEVSSFDGSRYIVNLEARTCDCRKWDLSGIPCKHAICAISAKGKDPDEYVHNCYSVETYSAVYEHAINLMNGDELWQKTGYIPPLPHAFGKKKKGRPLKERKFGLNEEPKKKKISSNLQKMPKQTFKVSCKYCGEKGHNRLGCKLRKDVGESTQSEKQHKQASNLKKPHTAPIVICSFCIDLGHTAEECSLRKQIEQDFEDDFEKEVSKDDGSKQKVVEVEGATIQTDGGKKVVQEDVQSNVITQPEYTTISQEDVALADFIDDFHESEIGVSSQHISSSKPTTRQGRQTLAYKRAKIGNKETKAPPTKSAPYSISTSINSAQPKQIGVQIRAPPPMSFHPKHFVGASIVPVLGDSMKVFTEDGKKYVTLSSLQATASQKERDVKKDSPTSKKKD